MLAFRVQLNDQPAVTGGAEDLGILTTTITAVGQLGQKTRRRHDGKAIDIHVRLAALTSRGQPSGRQARGAAPLIGSVGREAHTLNSITMPDKFPSQSRPEEMFRTPLASS